MPVRVQRKRKRGWKMPENTVSVARPGRWGNPLKIMGDFIYIDASYRRGWLDPWVILCSGDLDYLLKIYRAILEIDNNYLNLVPAQNPKDLQYWVNYIPTLNYIENLKGKNLACFCSLDSPCHADVLLSFVNDNRTGE